MSYRLPRFYKDSKKAIFENIVKVLSFDGDYDSRFPLSGSLWFTIQYDINGQSMENAEVEAVIDYPYRKVRLFSSDITPIFYFEDMEKDIIDALQRYGYIKKDNNGDWTFTRKVLSLPCSY